MNMHEQVAGKPDGGSVGNLMFSQMVKTTLNWPSQKKQARTKYIHKLGESGERRIIRMAKAGYNVWEAWQILEAYDYATIGRIYKKHGFDTKGSWA